MAERLALFGVAYSLLERALRNAEAACAAIPIRKPPSSVESAIL